METNPFTTPCPKFTLTPLIPVDLDLPISDQFVQDERQDPKQNKAIDKKTEEHVENWFEELQTRSEDKAERGRSLHKRHR